MLGVLITLLLATGAIGVGSFLVGRWTTGLDRAEALGVHGLVGLGSIGLLTLFVGLLPDGLKWGVIVVITVAGCGYIPLAKAFRTGELKFAKPEGPSLLFVLSIGAAAVFALVGALAPSDTLDWDTLAYHLAVPKQYLQSGQIHLIPALHQSNFPLTVDGLYIWGLTWGGESGAKAFSLAFMILGIIALFGIARSRYGALAGWWAALVFATIPVVMWESGTAYIDVAHGLYGGLGILYAARFVTDTKDRSSLWISAIFLGFAAGSKYTGLQTIAVVGLVVLIVFALRKQAAEGFKSAVLVGLVAMAISGSWYVKNIVQVGNPVYPFFYEKLGGKDWDQKRADVYREEQQGFGAGTLQNRHNPTQIGTAVLGLAYQPGRYVNPREDIGLGTPLGAIGVVVVLSGLLWALSGKLSSYESFVLGVIGISMLMWFFLTQQSRYVVPLAVPLAVLAGGCIEKLKVGKLLAGVAILQTCFSLYLVYSQRFQDQLQVVLGKVSAEEYQTHNIAFYEASQDINKEAVGGKVALYDEVFGFFLDVPYMWANPPHSTLIPYDSMTDAASYVDAMKKLGFTHIYISLSSLVKPDQEFVKRWLAAMGLNGAPVPFSDEERKGILAEWRTKWEVLLADAVAQKLIVPVKGFKHGILFKIL